VKLLAIEVVVNINDVIVEVTVTMITLRFCRLVIDRLLSTDFWSEETISVSSSWLRPSLDERAFIAGATVSTLKPNTIENSL
jgi:hypothetical protein